MCLGDRDPWPGTWERRTQGWGRGDVTLGMPINNCCYLHVVVQL